MIFDSRVYCRACCKSVPAHPVRVWVDGQQYHAVYDCPLGGHQFEIAFVPHAETGQHPLGSVLDRCGNYNVGMVGAWREQL